MYHTTLYALQATTVSNFDSTQGVAGTQLKRTSFVNLKWTKDPSLSATEAQRVCEYNTLASLRLAAVQYLSPSARRHTRRHNQCKRISVCMHACTLCMHVCTLALRASVNFAVFPHSSLTMGLCPPP